VIAVSPGVARWLVLVVCATCMACTRSGTGETATVPLKSLSAAELRAVPTEAALDLPLQASVYAWRDFMPTLVASPADSVRAHDLRVSVQVRGGIVPPKTLACDGIYLVSGDSVFKSPPAEQRAGDGPGAVECILRGGPEWPIGATVLVVISVSAGAQRTYIRRETTIDATS
jgi:hypothetical protein